jgi:hypothetical protein
MSTLGADTMTTRLGRSCVESHLFDGASGFIRNRKPPQTVKLTFHHRPKSRNAICRHLIHRMNQNRPHISSDISYVKERGSGDPETKTRPVRPNLLARPPVNASKLSASVPLKLRSISPSGVSRSASAPPVKGVLRLSPNLRKRFFQHSQEKSKMNGENQ